MYKSKRSLKVYEAPLGLMVSSKFQEFSFKVSGSKHLDITWAIKLMFSVLVTRSSSIK